MALETAFQELLENLEQLHVQVAKNLLWVIQECKPQEAEGGVVESSAPPDPYLAGRLEDLATELLGTLEEARSAALQAGPGYTNPAWTVHALIACQERFNQFTHQYQGELMSYEELDELKVFGTERGGAWLDWANNVKVELDRCRQPFFEVNQALFACWKEFAERTSAGQTVIQTTNIGQQIRIPARHKNLETPGSPGQPVSG
jgi:hypothetical protein